MSCHIKSISLLITFTLSLGCSTQQLRIPAQEANLRYQFQQTTSCDQKSLSEIGTTSALSGFMAGPQLAKQLKTEDDKILRPFTSDGCSLSPDGIPMSGKSQAWVQCCVVHDTHYWMGGTAEQREKADNELGQCIADKGFKEIGNSFVMAVKYFGGPNSSQTYRWGYGWNYKRPYKPLEQSEIDQVVGLYGTERNDQLLYFQTQAISLVNLCRSQDLAADGFNSDEKIIFDHLNSKLKKNEFIEWAKMTYFNLEMTEYKIKLKGCSETITARLMKRAHQPIELISTCDSFK